MEMLLPRRVPNEHLPNVYILQHENRFAAMFGDLRRDAQNWFERQRAGFGAARAPGENRCDVNIICV